MDIGESERYLASLAHSSRVPPDRRHFCDQRNANAPCREQLGSCISSSRSQLFSSRHAKHARPTSFRRQHPGALRPDPAGPREAAAAPARETMDSASRTRLARHARTSRSRAPLTSTRFPPTRPGVVRVVRARPRGPTRLQQDAAVLAVRRITQSSPMFAVRAQAPHTARTQAALDARPL